jgi:hypothetical protein
MSIDIDVGLRKFSGDNLVPWEISCLPNQRIDVKINTKMPRKHFLRDRTEFIIMSWLALNRKWLK